MTLAFVAIVTHAHYFGVVSIFGAVDVCRLRDLRDGEAAPLPVQNSRFHLPGDDRL